MLDYGECSEAMYFNSKIHAGSSKGAARFNSGMGLRALGILLCLR